LRSFIITHWASHCKLKMRSSECFNHFSNEFFNLGHLRLNISNLNSFLIISTVCFLNLPAKALPCWVFIRFTHWSKWKVVVYLVSDLLVLLLNHIDVWVKHVNVVIQGVVLFLSFDKRSNDFLNWTDSRRFFNLIEGMLNDINIAHVHLHKSTLLLVICNPPT
jgi:hypothetical protein